MKKFLKYLLVLIFPLLIFDLVLIIKYGVDNFKDLFIVGDLNSQYISLIRWIQDVFQGDANIFYSFSKGIGGNMFSTFAYYISSPLNLILIFFEKYSYITAICVLIHIKFSLSSLTMFIFLKQKFKNSKFMNLLLFSTIYALSGVIINFYANIMWTDIYILTPLVILGLENIINLKGNKLYIISLSLAMISNFYMAFMLCIFCVIYFVYNILLEKKEKNKSELKKIIKKFIFSSIIAALIAGIILIPTIIDMANNMYRYDLNKPILYFDIDSIIMVFSKLFIGSMDQNTLYSHYEANIYVSIFSLILIIIYFFDKNNGKRDKILTLSVILLFFISIVFNGLNLIWHAFSFPNGFNYRFVYFLTFFLITISCKEFLSINKDKKFKLDKSIIKLLSVALFLIVVMLYNRYSYLSNIKIIITIIFIIIYLIYIYKKQYIKPLFIYILVILELGININYSFISKKMINEWYQQIFGAKVVEDVTYYTKKLCSSAKKTLGRNDIMQQVISYNDAFICNYSSITTALSTNHKRYYKFLNNAGYSITYSTVLNDFSNGPFIDSILGLKYFYRIDPDFQAYYKFYNKFDIKHKGFESNFVQYENPYALNLGYIVNLNDSINYDRNAFEYQNDLAKKMSGLNINIFDKVEVEELSKENNMQAVKFYAEDKYYYIYNHVPVPINNVEYGTLDIIKDSAYSYSAGSTGIVALEDHVVNEDIIVRYKAANEYKDYIDLKIYSFNQENFEKVINVLKEKQLNVTKREKNTLEGNIDVENDNSLLMITVPYEKGWNIYVDGKKVEYEEVYDTFVGIRLDKGHHEIKMVFYSPGIILGLITTTIGIFIFLINIYVNKKEKKLY